MTTSSERSRDERRPTASDEMTQGAPENVPRRRRVLLTRSEDDAAAWAEALERAGHEPVLLPCITTQPLDTPALAAALLEAAADADWLVFTSRRGVDAFARLVGDAAAITHARVAVVGDATGESARRLVGRVDVVSERGTAESLAAALTRPGISISGARVVLALAENAGDVLEHALEEAGASCRRFDVYRTVPAAPHAPKQKLSALDVDAVWLASPSAVAGFLNQVEVDDDAAIVAIGPSTAKAVRKAGLEVTAEAETPSFEGLLRAMP